MPHLTPDVQSAIDTLLSALQRTLGTRLAGLYLHGSLVIRDFDPEVSAIDLLAVLSSDLSPAEIASLQEMHRDFAAAWPA